MVVGESYRLVKIGGSLLTDKRTLATPNADAVRGYGQAIAKLVQSGRPLIFVAGGGSFGNAKAHEGSGCKGLDARSYLSSWRDYLERNMRVECSNLEVMLARQLWKNHEGGHFEPGPVLEAIDKGRTPLLLGDELISQGKRRMISSDLLPLFLSRRIRIDRVVMLTDVDGILHDGVALPVFDDKAQQLDIKIGSSGAPDVTGGMKLKVNVMKRLSRQEVQGVICKGTDPERLQHALYDPRPPGTLFPANQAHVFRG